MGLKIVDNSKNISTIAKHGREIPIGMIFSGKLLDDKLDCRENGSESNCYLKAYETIIDMNNPHNTYETYNIKCVNYKEREATLVLE